MAKTKHLGVLAAGALVAVALLVLMLMLVNPQTAGGALPGANGHIAYVAYDGNDTEIYTIPATGGPSTPVTNNTVPDSQPSYSPDGTRIAYAGAGGKNCGTHPADCVDDEIWTIPATGATAANPAVQVTCDLKDDTNPSYSPDGTRIAYAGGGAGNIRIFAGLANPILPSGCVANGFQQSPGPFDDKDPSWTRANSRIAYYSFDGSDFEIFQIEARTVGPIKTPIRATNNTLEELFPDYRPGFGSRIVYSGTGTSGTDAPGDLEIYTVRRPPFAGFTHTPVQLTFNNTEDLTPVYSPDATRIAYSGRDQQAGQVDWEIYTIPVSGGTPVKVTDNSRNDVHPSWQPIP